LAGQDGVGREWKEEVELPLIQIEVPKRLANLLSDPSFKAFRVLQHFQQPGCFLRVLVVSKFFAFYEDTRDQILSNRVSESLSRLNCLWVEHAQRIGSSS
jgi:hypothetical protein